MSAQPGLDAVDALAAVTTLSLRHRGAGTAAAAWRSGGARGAGRSRETPPMARRCARCASGTRSPSCRRRRSTWRMLLEAGWRGGRQWKALCGGEAMPVELAEALLRARRRTVEHVRPDRNHGVVDAARASMQARATSSSAGRSPTPRCWVLDADGAALPRSAWPARLCIGGDGVALGYHAAAGADRRALHRRIRTRRGPGALYRTGDLGPLAQRRPAAAPGPRWTSRSKCAATASSWARSKSRCRAVPPSRRPWSSACPARAATHVLVAYLVTRAAQTAAARRVARAPARAPARLHGAAALRPLDAVAADAQWQDGPQGAARASARGRAHGAVRRSARTRTATERSLAELWCELLGIEQVGVQDNFLDLGGHSLLVMRAVALLQARTGARLSPRAFVFQTLEQIAAECDAATCGQRNRLRHRRGLLKRVIARFGQEPRGDEPSHQAESTTAANQRTAIVADEVVAAVGVDVAAAREGNAAVLLAVAPVVDDAVAERRSCAATNSSRL